MSRPAVTIAARAARAAGNIILRYMNRIDGLHVVEKQHLDFVSEVDKLAEAEIIKELRRAYPDHAILGEEDAEHEKAAADVYEWIIDPIDGTVNFFHGSPWWCCSVARGWVPTSPRAIRFPRMRRSKVSPLAG